MGNRGSTTTEASEGVSSSGLGPTKKEIADHLGLDRSTVSKILNNYNRDRFSPSTVQRVEQAARELGYMRAQRRGSPRHEAGATARLLRP